MKVWMQLDLLSQTCQLMVNYPLVRIELGLRIAPAAWEWNQHPSSSLQMIPVIYVLSDKYPTQPMFIVLECCWHCHCTAAWTLDLQQHVRPKKNVVLTLITSSLVTLTSAPQHSCHFKVRELMTAAMCSLKKWMFEKKEKERKGSLISNGHNLLIGRGRWCRRW